MNNMEKKKLLTIFVAVLVLGSLSVLALLLSNRNMRKFDNMDKQLAELDAIEAENENIKKEFLEVMDNKKEFLDTNKEKVKINDHIKKIAKSEKQLDLSYTTLDIDDDGYDELIAKFEGYDIFYIILNYDNKNIYGYDMTASDMMNLKTDGSFWKNESSTKGSVVKCKFPDNNLNYHILAQFDGNKYVINEKNVKKDEFYKYLQDEFYSKTSVEWKKYKEVTFYKEDESFFGGTYVYENPNGAGKQTLIIRNNKIEWKNEISNVTRTGDYTVEKNTVDATYTQESTVNNNKQLETNQISRNTKYTIMEDGVYYMQEGVKMKFVKK